MIKQSQGRLTDIHAESGPLPDSRAGSPDLGEFHAGYQRYGKRAFDLFFASGMLVVFLPLFVAIFCLLRMRGVSPTFYRHERIGRGGQKFDCLKFTTMYPGSIDRLHRLLETDPQARAEWEASHKLRNDPRVIPGIGRFLRSSSLDELPQLFNVLRGEMSIVGPRPVTEDEIEAYGPFLRYYLLVKPGLTGPWQIGGRSDTTFQERVRKDVWYVRNANAKTDLTVLLRTVVSFATGRLSGAC
jgi:lipopolysaccharide/colanic/teichoic acid biosynthesis glycosyltransferase